MNLAENLKKLRKERNLSQEQLAEALNISRQAVSKWESGKTYPDIDNLILLRKLFNITLDDLIIKEYEIKGTVEIDKVSNNEDKEFDEEEDDLSVNLSIGGFIIGMSIGFVTGKFIWGIAGSFIGMGIGYIIEHIRKNTIINNS